MQRERTIFRSIRWRLLARASTLALRVAPRQRGWASGLLAASLVGASAPALAQATVDLATDADLVIQGAAAGDSTGRSVRERATSTAMASTICSSAPPTVSERP